MPSLAGKTCVITGAGRGLGRAIAETFAREGGAIVGAARSETELGELKTAVEAAGARCIVERCDVTRPEDIARLAAAADAAFGGIDVWVNNAGGFTSNPAGMGEWLDLDAAGVDAMLHLNVTAQVLGAKAAAVSMRRHGRGGSIIFMSSIAGLYSTPGGEGLYGACKAALNHITQTMATEFGQYNIRVNGIAPGLIETPLTAPFFPTPEEKRRRSAYYPLSRIGQPADVANAALYFASDEAGWVSGATLLVAGGATFTSDPYRYLQARSGNAIPSML